MLLFSQAGLSVYVMVLYWKGFNQCFTVNIPSIFAIFKSSLCSEGPLLFLYTRSVIYQKISFEKYDILLVLPVFIYVVALIMASIQFETAQGADFLLLLRAKHIQYYKHLPNIIRAGLVFGRFIQYNVIPTNIVDLFKP